MRLLAVFVLVSGTLVMTGVGGDIAPASASALWAHGVYTHSSGLDSASSAIPTPENPAVTDNAQNAVRTSLADSKAAAVSVATSHCDGCSAKATTFQVVYFNGDGAAADNSAAAWSTCTSCSASAVSVQLVLVRTAKQFVANNAAVALNVNCVKCSTTSAAIQFVIAGSTGRQLSAQAQDMIDQIQGQLADRLKAATPPSGARSAAPQLKSMADDTANRLQQIILKDVGTATVQVKVDVQVGQ
jgi:hypothetical protein